MPVTANPYLTLCSDFDPPPMKKCKICEGEGTRMGSIVCAADDQRTLDRIFAMTSVRARPVFGIITPVCDECRERIDMFDEEFEPQVRDLLLQDLETPVVIEEYDPLLENVVDSKNLNDSEAWEENFEHDPSDPVPSFVERQVTVESSEHVEDLPEPHDSCEPAQQSTGDRRLPSRDTQVEEPSGISDSKNLILVDDPKKIFKNMCPICAKQCKSLKSHIKIHVRKGMYVCLYCRAKFRTRSLLAYHNATHTQRPFCCNLCTKTYRTVFTLKAHMKQHSRTPAYQCEFCPKAFNSDTCWKIHIRTHKGEKPFPCSICGRTFGTPYNRKVHEMRHQNKRDYQCDKCPKGFFSPKELRTHQIRHIKVGLRTFPQITEQLQKMGTAKEELLSKAEGFINDHLYETVEKQCPKQFSCSDCYKSFHDKSQLRLHVKRMHSAASLGKSNVRYPKIDKEAAEKQMASLIFSDPPFVCDVCARSFQSGRGLRQHLHVHIRGVKVHRCSHCPKVFFQIGHMQEHELTHTGQKPFSCPVCGRCFNRNYLMERHRREQHPDEIIPDGSQESNPGNEPLIVDLNGQVATDFVLDSVGIETRAMDQTDLLTLKVDGAEPTNETDTVATSPEKVRKKVRFSDVLEVEYFNPNECHISRIPKSSNRPGILKGSLKKDKGSLKPPPETCAVPMVHPTPVTSTILDMDTVAPKQQNSSISESAFTLQEAEAKVNPELSRIDAMNSPSTLQQAETMVKSELNGTDSMNNPSTMLEDETMN
ncbi:zinc finger and BTB domain-containing protein 17-like [Anopheles bellator]|uniref:zinc finger and BTB domain-containing protein 17-like n=1 Tax=Anopheles bellator TaxID=139047 RepID=UPI0026470CF3|nr:zinc finger and BTB domain-containing protein 17-like [Anopheles bellator]